MKRYNFSCYASEKQEAVSRTTTTKPQDFVGEARITRFRLSRGSIPIFYLEPSKVGYSEGQKNQIIASGVTPTDICFYITQFSLENNKPNEIPNNTCQFVENILRIASVCECDYNKQYDLNSLRTMFYSSICVAYPTPPTFEKRGTSWYLTTEKYPIYDWDSLNKETVGLKYVSGPVINNATGLLNQAVIKLQVKEENGFPLFHINLFETVTEYYYYNIRKTSTQPPTLAYDSYAAFFTDPILFMNKEALELFGMNITEMPSIVVSNMGVIGHFTDRVTFFAPPLRVKDPSPDLSTNLIVNTIDTRFTTIVTLQIDDLTKEIETRATQLTYSLDFDPCLITVPGDIYPVSQILITSDELDFQGESISVDTTARQGVVDPSSLHILKSFFVGISDTVEIDASDFVYIDDSLNQSPVIVNSPRICSLTFRVWFLLKSGELKKCILEPGKGFSLQIGLY